MRKRRAIIFDDEPMILGLLADVLEELEYEVIAFSAAAACPVYQDAATSCSGRLCADVMITDLEMPGMSGLEMLEHQARRGCGLDVRNKAVHSGSLDAAAIAAIGRLGSKVLRKPVHLANLVAWIRECEGRMNLARPLVVRRRERRDSDGPDVMFAAGPDFRECAAQVVNRSVSGLCLRVDRSLAVGQVLDVRPAPPAPLRRGVVRWSMSEPASGRFLAGISLN